MSDPDQFNTPYGQDPNDDVDTGLDPEGDTLFQEGWDDLPGDPPTD